MNNVLLLFPNQLFSRSYLMPFIKKHEINEVILVEDPVFYGDRDVSLRLNKLRLAYQYALVRQYIANNNIDKPIELWSYDVMKTDDKQLYQSLNAKEKVFMLDPMDHLLMSKIREYIHTSKLVINDSPMFLLGSNDIDEFWNAKPIRRHIQHSEFYNFVKKKLHILEKERSFDTENRQAYPVGNEKDLPSAPWRNKNVVPESLWKSAAEWIDHHFPKNPGKINMNILWFVATTHIEVKAWLQRFLRDRFANFGKYQDAIVKGNNWMFHSGIAVYLNFGLITPSEVVEVVKYYYERLSPSVKKAQLPSYEGFIRQLIGWREYSRLYYVKVPVSIWRKNVFRMRRVRELSNAWYEGKTGVPIIDDTIRDAFETGYLHHIRRLMIMSNYMTLSNIHPDNVYQWMYEFSMDSWDWVMAFNVYSMGTWSDAGFAMRKPYISSVAYVKRMSHEPSGEWESVWQNKWNAFLAKNKEILMHTQLASIIRAQRKPSFRIA